MSVGFRALGFIQSQNPFVSGIFELFRGLSIESNSRLLNNVFGFICCCYRIIFNVTYSLFFIIIGLKI